MSTFNSCGPGLSGSTTPAYSDYDTSTVVMCTSDCSQNDPDYLLGCPTTAMTYDSSVCTSATMMDIPANTAFVLDILPNENFDVQGCTLNGITADTYGEYNNNFRIRACAEGKFTSYFINFPLCSKYDLIGIHFLFLCMSSFLIFKF